MKKYFLKIFTLLSVLIYCSPVSAQWSLVTNTDDGKYSLAANSGTFFGVSGGKILTESVFALLPGDSTSWRLVSNTDNGLYSLAENKVSYMGIDSGKIKTKAVFLLNPPTLTSLGLDTNRLAYVDKSNSFIGRKQTFDTVNATVKYLLNGTDINTGGALSNVAYLNQTNTYTGNEVVNAPSLTGSATTSIYNISQTWNTSGTPTAFKMNITNTSSNGSSLLMDLQTNGSSVFKIDKAGGITTQDALYSQEIRARNTSIVMNTRFGGGSTAMTGFSFNPLSGSTLTSGTYNAVDFSANNGFSPTSGSGVYNLFSMFTIVNQTGGANGITRGVYINPTITSAADWRAIESTTGSLVMSDSYLAGSGSLTGSLVNLSQTWNTSGAPTMFKMNATNTASSTASLLMDLQLNGSSVFSVRRDGKLIASAVISVSDVVAGPNNGISWLGRGGFASPSASNVYVFGTSFSCFGIGGTNSSFPGLSPSTNGSLKIMLADLSGYAKTIGGDFVHDDSSKGTVLKDSNGHYWRVSVNTSGVLSTTDLGTILTGF